LVADGPMPYVNLGNSGLQVSRICLGCMSYGDPSWKMCPWVLDEATSRPFIKRALELGINFFDTANGYSEGKSEEILGRAIRDYAVREQVVIATKVYFQQGPGPNQKGLSRKHIMDSVDNSLRRLGMDYIDLLQIHRWDDETPIEETMDILHDVVKSGKVRYIGASSMYTWQLAKAQHYADKKGITKFISMQNLWNLLYREEEREMVPFCLDQGISCIPWSPLANGYLTGTRAKAERKAWEPLKNADTKRGATDGFANWLYDADEDWETIEKVKAIATQKKVKPAQVALAWLLQKDGLAAPIIGATKMYQLEEAVAALQVELSTEEIASLESSYKPKGIKGIFGSAKARKSAMKKLIKS